ncbi:MAG: (2Fe-2S) ferredoxin domain-containing protein [Burkholderiales bacterium]|nr:NAD(P)H-dependent oxidoreductase subunit E [Sulfuricellaceae bacterium]
MSYYQKHLFFCTNQREDGSPCCSDHDAQAMRDYAKKRVKALNLNGEGKIRVNSAGCLGRCGEGPVIVVYPEAVWYTYVDQEDIDEIVDEHLVNGQVVDRLKI